MCGIAGVYFKDQAARDAAEVALNLLLRLQHRGQDGAGITVCGDEGSFNTVRGMGLVPNALKDWGDLGPSRVALAHTRYATTGKGEIGELQPFVEGSPRIALAHNGNIVNTSELREKFKITERSHSDLDVLMQVLLAHWHRGENGFVDGVKKIFDEFNGGYAVVGLEEDKSLFAFRDPYGIRPLFFAQNDQICMVASETCAFDGFANLRVEEIAPGSWIRIKNGEVEMGLLSSDLNPRRKRKYCMFESVYFASAQSEIADRSVFGLRFEMGKELAEEIRQKLPEDARPRDIYDYVVPVPETSRVAATAVAEGLGVPYREFLIKNPYIPRTFILANQTERLKALRSKMSLVGPEIVGKRILLVDDSVVRGNTSRLMSESLRRARASSVALASTCPPIRFGCYYGIDFPDPEELVASKREIPEVATEIGVDELFYLSIEGLKRALGTKELCLACLDGKYPTFNQSFDRFLSERRRQRSL